MIIPRRSHFKNPWKWLLALGSETAARPFLEGIRARYASGPTTAPTKWRKGLLIGADHIGDILYRTPSLDALQRAFPLCKWHWLVRPPADQILAENPFIEKTLVPAPASSRTDLAQRIKVENYDVALCYDVGAYISSLHLVLKAGIPNRIAYAHKGFSAWVTHPVSFQTRQSFPGYFRELVAGLAHIPPDWPLRPQVFPSQEDEMEAQAFLEENNLVGHPRMLACFVTSRQPTASVWPLENFIEVMRQISAEPHVRLVLCGAPGDRTILEICRAKLVTPATICAGDLSLRALTCFLKKCRAVLSPDSGPRHLANAAGTPVVFVRNPLSNPIDTGVYWGSESDFADTPLDQQVSAVIQKLRNLIR